MRSYKGIKVGDKVKVTKSHHGNNEDYVFLKGEIITISGLNANYVERYATTDPGRGHVIDLDLVKRITSKRKFIGVRKLII